MRSSQLNQSRKWAFAALLVVQHWSLCLLLGAVAFAENPYAASARSALVDLQMQPAERRPVLRYLSVGSKREELVVSYLLNAVSRSRLIIRPEGVQPGLLRIDLSAYANPRQPATLTELITAWEGLVAVDPYFHLRTQVVLQTTPPAAAPARPTLDQRPTQVLAKSKNAQPAVATPAPQTVTVDAGWIAADVAAALRLASGSAGVVLRADYFIARVAAAPSYYDFAGIPTKEGELLARLGIDRPTVDKLSADSAANLLVSNVTSKPRRIVRLPGPLGGTWLTRDIERETPDRDPLRNPVNFNGPAGRQALAFDASEWFAQKENKFWLTAVFDAAGNRQDAVADRIAKDTTAHDGIVRPLVSCVRCHELNGGRAAMQPFNDDQFPLLSGEVAILRSYLPEVARRVTELYDPVRLAREQERDREDYTVAVEQATGVDPHAAVEALADAYAAFVDRLVTRELAAVECGVDVERFTQATSASTDPIILALRSGRAVKRSSYEASIPELMVLVAGVAGR